MTFLQRPEPVLQEIVGIHVLIILLDNVTEIMNMNPVFASHFHDCLILPLSHRAPMLAFSQLLASVFPCIG